METPGTILKREREVQGLSLKDISAITRIPVKSLQYIEDDRFELLPADVFAKGFLRNYARELGIDPEPIILSYNALKSQWGFVPGTGERQSESLPHIEMAKELDKKVDPISRPVQTLPNAPTDIPGVNPFRVFAQRLLSSADRAREDTPTNSPLNRLSWPGKKPRNEGEEPNVVPPVMDQGTHAFKFAYLIVFLVVATSLGLSMLFSGTGEAEENQRIRPVQEKVEHRQWGLKSSSLVREQKQSARTLPVSDLSPTPASNQDNSVFAKPIVEPEQAPAVYEDDE